MTAATDQELVTRPSGVRIAQAHSEATAVEQSRAVAEVLAAVEVAKRFPRDRTVATERMREACRHKSLAERAFYSLPRAGGRIEGSTVHLARELADCWGNIEHGLRELRRDDAAGQSEVLAWAWDVETNVRASRSFVVPHARMSSKSGTKRREPLEDLGDIANNNNSVGSRAVREVIWQVLPVWFRTQAEELCTKTLQDGGGQTMEQRRAVAVERFLTAWGVTAEQLEERLQRPRGQWTPQDIGVLLVIDGELTRGEKRIEDEFPVRGVTDEQVAAATRRTRAAVPAAPAEPQAPAPPPALTDDADAQALAEYEAEQARQPGGLFGTDDDA